MNAFTGQARDSGIACCHSCGLASRVGNLPAGTGAYCPRCESELHLRKPHSLSRTWALVIAGYVMYIPANVLPVSTILYLGETEPDTILSGVVSLFRDGDVPIALILFTASIAVPILKLTLLTWLLLTVTFRSHWRPRDRTVIYRVIETIGRWSMLDVFVISMLVALVQLRELATVHAGPGALAFCVVVVLTLFAAKTFDPRLIWDAQEKEA